MYSLADFRIAADVPKITSATLNVFQSPKGFFNLHTANYTLGLRPQNFFSVLRCLSSCGDGFETIGDWFASNGLHVAGPRMHLAFRSSIRVRKLLGYLDTLSVSDGLIWWWNVWVS